MQSDACCVPRKRLREKRLDAHLAVLRALGDETRLRIVSLLAAAQGELCVCDIEARFALSQPTISHHLRLLREAGVVQSERRGTWVYYRLDRATCARLSALVDALTEGT
jgi:ArsR family transcriptional regulator